MDVSFNVEYEAKAVFPPAGVPHSMSMLLPEMSFQHISAVAATLLSSPKCLRAIAL